MEHNCSENKRAKAKKQNFLLSSFYFLLFSGPVLLLQIGCQEQAGPAGESKVTLATPELAIGQEKTETAHEEIQADKPAPKITFEKVVHDFGEVGPKTKQVGEFRFTNTGDGLLKITNVQRCCGVSTKLSKREYAPGESGTLKVEFNIGTGAGAIMRRLYVHSNDSSKPKVTLTIMAKIVPKVSWEPNRLRLSLDQENAGCSEITLTSLDDEPFSIGGFKSTANCITADYDPSVKAAKFVLKPKVDMEKLQKNLKGRVNISLTHPECDMVTILFDVLTRFTISPSQIIVLKAEPQKPIVRKLWVLSNYDEDFEIESTSSKNNTIKVLSQKEIRKGYEFEVEITPPPAKDEQSIFMDAFFVNLKGGEKVTITCRGFYSRQ